MTRHTDLYPRKVLLTLCTIFGFVYRTLEYHVFNKILQFVVIFLPVEVHV